MISFTSVSKAQEKISQNARLQRLATGLTQKGLADRANVALPTLRKFEQKGLISLESFLKLQMVLGGLENIIKSVELKNPQFSSIDEVLKANKISIRKRGNRR